MWHADVDGMRICYRRQQASKSKNKQSTSAWKSRDVDVSAATIVPFVRAFPTRQHAKSGVKYRSEELEL